MNTEYKENQLIMFFDQIGHVALAEFISQDETHVRIKNPMYLAVVPQQSKKDPERIEFRFETPTWLFRDFMADHNQALYINIRKDCFSFADAFEVAEVVRMRYYNNFSKIISGMPQPVDANGNPIDPKIIEQMSVEPEEKPKE